MAERTWISTGSTDAMDPANYTGAGPILSSDVLVFDGSSVVNADQNADFSIGGLEFRTGYTGKYDNHHHVTEINGGNLLLDAACNADFSDSTVIMHGGTLRIGSAFLSSSAYMLWDLVAADSLEFIVNKESLRANSLTIYAGKTVNIGGTALSYGLSRAAFSAVDASLILHDGASINNNLLLSVISSEDGYPLFKALGSYTWGGTGLDYNGVLYGVRFTTQANNVEMPSYIYTGSAALHQITPATTLDCSMQLMGPIDVARGTLAIERLNAGDQKTLTVVSNGNSIKCGPLRVANSDPDCTVAVNLKNSIVDCTGIDTESSNIGQISLDLRTRSLRLNGGEVKVGVNTTILWPIFPSVSPATDTRYKRGVGIDIGL